MARVILKLKNKDDDGNTKYEFHHAVVYIDTLKSGDKKGKQLLRVVDTMVGDIYYGMVNNIEKLEVTAE